MKRWYKKHTTQGKTEVIDVPDDIDTDEKALDCLERGAGSGYEIVPSTTGTTLIINEGTNDPVNPVVKIHEEYNPQNIRGTVLEVLDIDSEGRIVFFSLK